MMTAEMKSRGTPSGPGHREQHNPGNPGEGEAPATPQPAQEGLQGITPLAGEALIPSKLTNYSVAPGFAWFELTNHSNISLAVGRQSVLGEMPARGGGEYLTAMYRPPAAPLPSGQVGQPVGLLVLNPTVLEGGGLEETGMSIEGFPGFPRSLPTTTALPLNVGFHSATIDPNSTPPRVTVYFEVRTAATITAGKRWIFYTMTGV